MSIKLGLTVTYLKSFIKILRLLLKKVRQKINFGKETTSFLEFSNESTLPIREFQMRRNKSNNSVSPSTVEHKLFGVYRKRNGFSR